MTHKDPPSGLKGLAIDSLGVLMLIGAVLFGWLPGPGGTPLLLGGLGLLSIRHKWARNILHLLKEKGSTLYEIFFPNNPWLHWLYDLVAVSIFAGAILLISNTTGNLLQALAFAGMFVGTGLFFTNRRRIEKINKLVRKIRRKA